jgi:hypothetical protein
MEIAKSTHNSIFKYHEMIFKFNNLKIYFVTFQIRNKEITINGLGTIIHGYHFNKRNKTITYVAISNGTIK